MYGSLRSAQPTSRLSESLAIAGKFETIPTQTIRRIDLKPRGYQSEFYNLYAKARDRESRVQQAEKIAYILTRFTSFHLGAATCLDIGCSSGTITMGLAPLFARIVGLDYDEIALGEIDRSSTSSLGFLRGDAMHLPLADDSIDVIICAQVYEHVPDDTRLVAEIYRVLKSGGIVYFSGPNKLFPIEMHYNLPFLHWLPERLADGYLCLVGRGDHYYERSRSWWSLRQLLSQFIVRDVTVEILAWKMQLAASNNRFQVFRRIPLLIWRLLLPAFPNYNWLLCKPLHPGVLSSPPDSLNNLLSANGKPATQPLKR